MSSKMDKSNKDANSIITHASTGKADDSFVGFKISGKEISFYYPYKFELASRNDWRKFRKDVISILQSISLAKTHSSKIDKLNRADSLSTSIDVESYLWIIKDFLMNGFYYNREKIYKINQKGKVDWKRTLRSQPIISNGNFIYNDIVVETRNNADDILLKIHKHCVRKSLFLLGWLFNVNGNFIEKDYFDEGIKKLYVQTLLLELDKTFDDIKKLRLKHMLNVLTDSIEGDNKKQCVYGVDDYNYVFERMVDKLFHGERKIEDFYPSSSWYVSPTFKEIKSSDLRPDTIVIRKNGNGEKVAYILDAKNYIDGNLPATDSIQKQITYGDFIKNNNLKNIKDVKSAFIIPYDKNKNDYGFIKDIEYYGYAKAKWKTGKENHEIVHAFMVDLRFVIENYRSPKDEEIINTLIEQIEDAVAKNSNS